jgi:hypothetical protein
LKISREDPQEGHFGQLGGPSFLAGTAVVVLITFLKKIPVVATAPITAAVKH